MILFFTKLSVDAHAYQRVATLASANGVRCSEKLAMLNRFKEIRIFFVACLVFISAGCDSPKLNPLNSNDVIVAFGDSLTVGVGANKENSYPSVLAELSGINIINSGVSGETTSEGLVRLPRVIDEYNPSLLILLEGGNDILQNQDYDRIEDNIDKMIHIALDKGVQVVLIGVPEKSLFSSSAPFYSDLAEKYDLVFEPDLIGSLMRSRSKKSDPIHFNEEGYAELAEGIFELLSDSGAFE